MKTSSLSRWLSALLLLTVPLTASAADGTAVMGGLGLLLLVAAGAVAFARPQGLLLSAAAGAALSLYLGMEHASAGQAICDISEKISCTAVNSSEYSKLLGVPVALYGFGFYLAMSWLAGRHALFQRGGALLLMQIGGVVAVGFDVYLGWAMSQVGALCPMCAATYVLNLLLLIGSTLERNRLSRIAGPGAGDTVFSALQSEGGPGVVAGLAGLILGIMVTGAGGSAAASAKSAGPVTADDLRGTYELAAGDVTFEPNDPIKGNPEAKYVLVEWADFQCPHCALMFPELKRVVEENPDVSVRYKHYPISQTCNHFVEWEGHKDACRAAAASVCANAQNAFWPLAEKMFKNQQYLSKDDIRFMVEQSGIDTAAFETCMADPATEAAVREDVEGGGKANINGTPSIFLKGPFGDRWVKINGGYEEITAILKVARAGGSLPEPPPPSAPAH